MSSATPRRHLSKDDKLAIIEASKSPGFSKEEAMKKWGIRRTQMYDLLKNKKVLETKLIESPARSAKRVSGLPQKQIELEDRLFRWIGLNERRGLLLDGVKICKQAQNLANEPYFSSGLQFTYFGLFISSHFNVQPDQRTRLDQRTFCLRRKNPSI